MANGIVRQAACRHSRSADRPEDVDAGRAQLAPDGRVHVGERDATWIGASGCLVDESDAAGRGLRCSDPDTRRCAVEGDDLERLLIEHTDAWNSHDLDRLMALFADDCVFQASGGPAFDGRRFEGRAQVRAAFADVLGSMPDASWGDGRHFAIHDDYGVSEWRLIGTLADGSGVDLLGCDFITVRGGRIVRKNSFRKQRSLVAE
jgi:taurine dehydrogenase small subunit